MITEDIKYIGVNDHEIDLFEGQYDVPNGMAYNSYIIFDEKIAVFDTVDKKFGDKWLCNVKETLDGKNPDYLIVSHMEPDHSANIDKFLLAFPKAEVVATGQAFSMMERFFGENYEGRRIIANNGDSLSLGKHNLTFYTAPMVHWPEVMVTYDSFDKVLFSADAFGKFGALDIEEDWACEARRYYFGIVGKYGKQVQMLFEKLDGLDIKTICPLHGPVLSENLGYYLGLYDTWSKYLPEEKGVVIYYTSVYGNTKKAVELLAAELREKGCPKVTINDLARCDMAEAIEDAFRYDKIVLATTTYNSEIFPFMHEFITGLVERGFKKRKVGFIENGSWAPQAAKYMRKMFEKTIGLEYCNTVVTILSAVNCETEEKISELAKELI